MKESNNDSIKKRTNELLSIDVCEENIEEIIEMLAYLEQAYYVKHDSIVPDEVYDQLFHKLRNYEQKYPQFIRPKSPTQRVGNDLSRQSLTVKHFQHMLSLANMYSEIDLIDFDQSIKKLLLRDIDESLEYTIEPKFDGSSVILLYEDNRFVRGATRGDGYIGEDISLNIKTLSTIPKVIDMHQFGIKRIELRGEAVILKSTFDLYNEQRIKQGLSTFANPRNAASGALRTKDPLETRKRGVEVFLFQVTYIEFYEEQATNFPKKHFEQLQVLGSLGFNTYLSGSQLCQNISDVYKYIVQAELHRDDYPFEIDGMVIKLDDTELQYKLGNTNHHPRWATAYKFRAKQAISVLNEVEFQVGKNGAVTPVAKVSPVYLGGVTISSISLHNEDFITEKDIRIGDKVVIERAGEVIPYIVRSLDTDRIGTEITIKFPIHCPRKHDPEIELVKAEGEAAWRCPECATGLHNIQKIIFHASKDAMDIEGMGKSIIIKFAEKGWIKDISDIYALDFQKIRELEGFGSKSADKLQAAIELVKKRPLHRILVSLSIHHLGQKASRLIAQRISHINELKNWTVENFTEVKDIGGVVAENVINFFSKKENIELIDRLTLLGLDFSQKDDDIAILNEDGILSGKNILFTGTLSFMGRKEAQELALKNGAKLSSAVSKNLDILVIGEKPGSKLKKATTIESITILTEEEFLHKLGKMP